MRAEAVILAGGRGTRSSDPSRAKVAQMIGDGSLLQWHLRVLQPTEIDTVIVVAGHLGDQVQRLCGDIDTFGMTLTVIREEQQRGTVAALALAVDKSQTDEFLVILGDVLMSLPAQHFLDEWRLSGRGVGVVVHPSTHPEDSDLVFPAHDGSVRVSAKGTTRGGVPNMASAGLFAINRRALTEYLPHRDIGSDLLAAAAGNGDLFAFVCSHYLKDTGTPERLRAAQTDQQTRVVERRGNLGARRALFLDRDGVINPADEPIFVPTKYTLLPGIAQSIRSANELGIPVIVLTNQPHISKGLMSFDDQEQVRAEMDRLLSDEGAFVDDYFFCPHHPERGFAGEVEALKIDCQCRKPGIGMAIRASVQHQVDLTGSVMVGDTERDREFAQATGMYFIHVSGNCAHCGTDDCFQDSASAISAGIEYLK